MLELEAKMRRALGINLPILLQGESGTGKGVLSRFIHKHSKRASGPYIRVNCANNADNFFELIASTLVGDEHQDNRASLPFSLDFPEWTLFLEHLGELSPKSQSQLFHSLPGEQDCANSDQPNPWTNARIVSATARNLRHEVNANRFRSDLFYR
jgi:DNA-binding NtrC family response regulator